MATDIASLTLFNLINLIGYYSTACVFSSRCVCLLCLSASSFVRNSFAQREHRRVPDSYSYTSYDLGNIANISYWIFGSVQISPYPTYIDKSIYMKLTFCSSSELQPNQNYSSQINEEEAKVLGATFYE